MKKLICLLFGHIWRHRYMEDYTKGRNSKDRLYCSRCGKKYNEVKKSLNI